MTDQFFRRHLARVPMIAVLRGMSLEDTVKTAHRCWDAGIELVEVPAQRDSGWDALKAAVGAAQERGQLIGAGTIYSVTAAARAVDAGVNFLVGPGMDEDTVHYAASQSVPYLPGVATPTEVQRATTLGVRTLKLFPAAPLGPSWITSLQGPFPATELVAVGGVSAANAKEFLSAGAIGVGVGAAITAPGAIQALAAL